MLSFFLRAYIRTTFVFNSDVRRFLKEFHGEGYDDSDKRILGIIIITKLLGIYTLISFLKI